MDVEKDGGADGREDLVNVGGYGGRCGRHDGGRLVFEWKRMLERWTVHDGQRDSRREREGERVLKCQGSNEPNVMNVPWENHFAFRCPGYDRLFSDPDCPPLPPSPPTQVHWKASPLTLATTYLFSTRDIPCPTDTDTRQISSRANDQAEGTIHHCRENHLFAPPTTSLQPWAARSESTSPGKWSLRVKSAGTTSPCRRASFRKYV